MPRALLIRSSEHAYHVTSRCNNKIFFPLPLSEVWPIMLDELCRSTESYRLQIHAFVLMGNHFHLLCHTPMANLDEVMRDFLRNTSVRVTRRAGGFNHLWGSRYRWSLIQSERHYIQVYKYILQNPVRAGLVKRVEDYIYSALNVPVPFQMQNFAGCDTRPSQHDLIWLNQSFQKEAKQLIQLGLKKAYFDVSQRKRKILEKEIGPKGE